MGPYLAFLAAMSVLLLFAEFGGSMWDYFWEFIK